MKYLIGIMLIGLLASCGDDQSSSSTNIAQVKTESKRDETGDNTDSRLEQSKESIDEASKRPVFTFFKDNEIEILSKVLSDSLIYQLDSLEQVLSSYNGEEDLISFYYNARELVYVLDFEIENNTEDWTWRQEGDFLLEWETIGRAIDKHQCFIFDSRIESTIPQVSLSSDYFIALAQKNQNKRDDEYFLLLRHKNGYWQRKWRSFCCDFDYFVNLGDSSMINFVIASSSYVKNYDVKKSVSEYKSISSMVESLCKDIFHGRYYCRKDKILSELDLLISFESDFLSASKEKMKLLRERIINDQLDCDDCDDGIGTIQLNCEKEICPCC